MKQVFSLFFSIYLLGNRDWNNQWYLHCCETSDKVTSKEVFKSFERSEYSYIGFFNDFLSVFYFK